MEIPDTSTTGVVIWFLDSRSTNGAGGIVQVVSSGKENRYGAAQTRHEQVSVISPA